MLVGSIFVGTVPLYPRTLHLETIAMFVIGNLIRDMHYWEMVTMTLHSMTLRCRKLVTRGHISIQMKRVLLANSRYMVVRLLW